MWSRLNKESSNCGKRKLKVELADLDLAIDKGDGEVIDVNRRHEVVRLLQDVEKIESLEVAQKAKIKWAIEGDENSKYYHGVLNKKEDKLLFVVFWLMTERLTKRRLKERCGIDKAPGPDGFTFGLYRRYWNLIESDVVDAISCFFQQGVIPKGGNSSFITLILKVPNANMMTDFRPISLIRSSYKIIAKILANCLITVLGTLVNETQSAFVTDRQILDGPIILNELVQWCKKKKKKKKQDMIFKVDFEKAYDSVRWDFLDDILKKSGFGENGDLDLKFSSVVDAGLFKGIVLSLSLNISHLFYVDDAIFMGQWSQTNIDTITHVLNCFHRASGLRINTIKSKLMGISVDISKVEQAAAKIGCVTLKTPFNYLGSKVGGLMSRLQSWNEIVESLATRLSRWKLKTISIGGRLTLFKSVLGVIPIYLMSIFKVLMKARVIKALHGEDDKIGKKVKSTYPSIWLNIIHEVELLKLQGIDLLSFIHSKLGNGKNTLFWEVAWHGDYPFKDLFPRIWVWSLERSGDFTVSSVRKLIDDVLLPEVSTKTRWIKAVPIKVNVHAWKVKIDSWHGDYAFKDLFPRMYALESLKGINVAPKLSHCGLAFSFRRNPRGGAEQAQFDLLKEKVEGCVLVDMFDRWVWSLEGSGDFTVSSVRKLIDDVLLPEVSTKTRWIKEVPIKVNVHAWKVKIDWR
nr:RNA-directed DNA polymerase, eukaryota, reverse transcriptase zinc-binding domain protein [Tanacetum cinerariifolium]